MEDNSMPMMERPAVRDCDGGRCWENEFPTFLMKVFVPENDLDGQTNNYGFRAPLLLVFEEEKQDLDSAVSFAKETGLSKIAAAYDSSTLRRCDQRDRNDHRLQRRHR